MSSNTLSMRQWWIGLQPPYGGFVPWSRISKSPEYPHDRYRGVLQFPLFSTKEEADAVFAENGFDSKEYRIVPVTVTISEVSEEAAKAEVEAGIRRGS